MTAVTIRLCLLLVVLLLGLGDHSAGLAKCLPGQRHIYGTSSFSLLSLSCFAFSASRTERSWSRCSGSRLARSTLCTLTLADWIGPPSAPVSSVRSAG